ncbi:MAG: hypothetical protein CMF70_02675 [Magnetovibrio sp.]|nr:hypothetical protein [Magnetovibrio sp.]
MKGKTIQYGSDKNSRGSVKNTLGFFPYQKFRVDNKNCFYFTYLGRVAHATDMYTRVDKIITGYYCDLNASPSVPDEDIKSFIMGLSLGTKDEFEKAKTAMENAPAVASSSSSSSLKTTGSSQVEISGLPSHATPETKLAYLEKYKKDTLGYVFGPKKAFVIAENGGYGISGGSSLEWAVKAAFRNCRKISGQTKCRLYDLNGTLKAGLTEEQAMKTLPKRPVQVSDSSKLEVNIKTLKRTKKCPKCYLKGANLSNINLIGSDLMLAVLEGANLKNSNLEGADLNLANLEQANLSNAVLKGANLYNAKFKGANLNGANLEGATLDNNGRKMAIAHGAIGLVEPTTTDTTKAKAAPLPKVTSDEGKMNLKKAKAECSDLGFKKGTEKYGDCVMKLID